MREVDILVIGGGLVGSSLATALSSHPLAKGISVMLVDPDPPCTREWPSLSLRTSTINPSSKAFLDEIGVWPRIPQSRVAAFDKMFVWDHPAPLSRAPVIEKLSDMPAGTLLFDASDVGEDVLGYVVDNDTLRNAMYRCMLEHSASSQRDLEMVQGMVYGIDFGDSQEEDVESKREDQAVDIDHSSTGGEEHFPWPIVELDNGDKIKCRLIVACDGARSRVRTLAGADWFAHGYDQSAVVANVTLRDPINTAYQRFVSTGPVAVLPINTDDTAAPVGNVIWTTTTVEAEALYNADDEVFMNELNIVLNSHEENMAEEETILLNIDGEKVKKASGSDVRLWSMMAKGLQIALPRLGLSDEVFSAGPGLDPPECLGVVGNRGRFPLVLGHAPRYVIEERRTVLVGDAAHSVHPLAGQGVNLGFADVQSLADCLASAAATGRDVGGERGAALMRFQRERMVANVGMMGVLHSLQRVFDRNSPAGFRELRRVGLSAINAVRPVKKLILRAMR